MPARNGYISPLASKRQPVNRFPSDRVDQLRIETGKRIEQNLEYGDINFTHDCRTVILYDIKYRVEHILLQHCSQEVIMQIGIGLPTWYLC